MKTKEALNALKAEYESLNRRLGELTDDEMQQVAGGMKIVVIKNSRESNASDINGLVGGPLTPFDVH